MKFTTIGLLIGAARSAVVGIAFVFSLGFAPAVLAQEEAPATEETVPAEAPVETIPVESTEAAPATEGATKLDTIEVTGSRLRRTDFETAQPVVVITREDIERSGLTDIAEILRNITAAGNNSLSTQQGRFALTMGETNLDLRNLGATHTLLLVNGRRWITGLIPTQTSVSDFNTIPTGIIERIEILKDGASAIYGSDAIAGVVNVITRKNYTGRELTYHFGQYFEQGDGNNHQASASWGTPTPGGGNLFLNLNYTEQGEASNQNHTLTAQPLAGPTRNSVVTPNGLFRFVDLNNTYSGFYQCPNLASGIAAGVAGEPTTGGPVRMTEIIPAGLTLCDLVLNDGAQGGPGRPQDYHQRDISIIDPDDRYNRFADGTLKEPNERTALFAQFEQPLADWIGFNFEALYNKRESVSVGQNGGLSGGNLGEGPLGYLAAIHGSSPRTPFPGQDIGFDSSCGGTADVADPNSPTCTGIGDGSGSWNIRRENVDLNNQEFHDSVDTIRLGGGLRGDFDLLDRAWFWDLGYIYGQSKIEEILTSVNYERAGRALGNAPCTGDCVELNLFQGPAGLTEGAINYIRSATFQRNRTRQDFAYLNLTSEFQVPGDWLAGPVAMAVGGEFRRDGFNSDIDPIIQQGLIRLNTLTPTDGKTYAREAYTEFGVPLLKDLPFAQSLDLSLAGRYSKFPRIDAVTTGKAGLRWQPLEDVLVRGTYSTGFRAPSVGELFLGASQSFDGLLDPCANPGANDNADTNCLSDGTPGGGGGGNLITAYDLWQGNPLLEPEKSKNLTYGLIYSPRWLPDLNVGVDFFDIEITDFVVIGQGQFFLDSCYNVPAEQRRHCETIHRTGNGDLLFVDTPYFNLAKVQTSGIDIAADYLLPLPAFLGRFKLNIDTSYLKEFKDAFPRVGLPDDVNTSVGITEGQFQGFPRWKATGYLSWQLDRLKASWTTRMAYHLTEACGDLFPVPSMKDLGLCSHPDVLDGRFDTDKETTGTETPENRLHTIFYHHVQVGYELTAYNADITLGVNNVLDQDPRISRGLNGILWYNFDPNHYEAPGRFGYVRAGFRF
jgi:iron complex outermembrane receptor protein